MPRLGEEEVSSDVHVKDIFLGEEEWFVSRRAWYSWKIRRPKGNRPSFKF